MSHSHSYLLTWLLADRSRTLSRNLRERIHSESYAFVKAQRLNQLRKGAWFLLPSINAPREGTWTSEGATDPTQDSWGFYRLSANMKTLCYTESPEEEMRTIKDGVGELDGRRKSPIAIFPA